MWAERRVSNEQQKNDTVRSHDDLDVGVLLLQCAHGTPQHTLAAAAAKTRRMEETHARRPDTWQRCTSSREVPSRHQPEQRCRCQAGKHQTPAEGEAEDAVDKHPSSREAREVCCYLARQQHAQP